MYVGGMWEVSATYGFSCGSCEASHLGWYRVYAWFLIPSVPLHSGVCTRRTGAYRALGHVEFGWGVEHVCKALFTVYAGIVHSTKSLIKPYLSYLLPVGWSVIVQP